MKQKKNLSALLLIAVVVLFSAFNLSLINKSNHISDTSLAQIEALAGDDPTGGEGSGGLVWPECIAGGKGASGCSIAVSAEILGSGVAVDCSTDCIDGYYACCGAKGCYCKEY